MCFMKRFLIFILAALLLTSIVFASDDVRTGVATGGGASSTAEENAPTSGFQNLATEGFIDQSVTTESFMNRLQNKGNDVIDIITLVGQYVCIAAFAICCIITLVGLIGNKRTMTGGVIGLIVSGVAYALLTMAPDVVYWIASWAAS